MGKRQLSIAAIGALLASLAFVLAACGGGDEDATGETSSGEVHVVGYPGLESAYEDALEPAFEKSIVFEPVDFGNAFGESGDRSRAVAQGAPASIVHLEQAGEMEQLVEEGVVDADWDEQPYGGMAHDTVIVFVVRKGNPKRIHNVGDILDGDVDVVVPNPFRSDTGRWSVMDVYATLINEGESEAEALAGVKRVLAKAVAQPDSAADALAGFLDGEGDVLLTYESQAIQAVEAGKGKGFQFIVPHQTILVETPIAVTKDAPEPIAREFLEFLWSEEGQILWAEEGYRPVEHLLVNQERFFPREAFKIARFGGWAKVNEEFFDPETGSVAEIERELGVPTGG
jgi:sulfate/thiosulfate transport system substrate-binding protein